MPGGLAPLADYLIALFSKLPYCRPVRVAPDYSDLTDKNNIGIQWIPSPTKFDILKSEPIEVRAA